MTKDLRGGDTRLIQLTPYECWQHLDGSDQIARVVWLGEAGPAIVPVNFTVSDGSIWFQVNPDSALGRHCDGQRILVEVDHADRATHAAWSVVVTGTARCTDVQDAPDTLRDLQVWPSGPHSACVRVETDEVSGRRLLPHR